MAIVRTFGLIGLSLFVLVGCKSVHDDRSTEPTRAGTNQVQNEGYSLLYELLGKEKNVNRVLLVKRETPELRELIGDIAREADDAADQLKQFATTDPTLDLNQTALPFAERKVRSSIQSARTKELLTSSGGEFELRLLLTQAEALTYGQHLAKTLAAREGDLRRRLFLENVSRRFEQLHQKLMGLLLTRMRSKR